MKKNEIVCKECGKKFGSGKTFGIHLRIEHDLSTKEYYDKWLKKPNEEQCEICGKPCNYINITKGYTRCCSNSCANVLKAKEYKETVSYTCKICNETFTMDSGWLYLSKKLQQHFREKHQLELKDYYDKFEKKEGEGICQTCGKPTQFLTFTNGYTKYCCRECQPNETRGWAINVKRDQEKVSIRERIKAMQDKIKNWYKSMVDDQTEYDETKPIDEQCKVIAKPMGLIANPKNPQDKFYTEVDTCDYNMPCNYESMEMKRIPNKKVDNLTEPKSVEWL